MIGRNKRVETDILQNKEFNHYLRNFLNANSIDSRLDTPDWVLAEYVIDCLKSLDRQNHNRDQWFGWNRDPKKV